MDQARPFTEFILSFPIEIEAKNNYANKSDLIRRKSYWEYK